MQMLLLLTQNSSMMDSSSLAAPLSDTMVDPLFLVGHDLFTANVCCVPTQNARRLGLGLSQLALDEPLCRTVTA